MLATVANAETQFRTYGPGSGVGRPSMLPEIMLLSVAAECVQLLSLSQHLGSPRGRGGDGDGDGGDGDGGFGGDGAGGRNVPDTIEPSSDGDWTASLRFK